MFSEYDVVTLKQKTQHVPLVSGTRGTVLLVHTATPPVYEVEFVDEKGTSLGVFTVNHEDLDLPST